MSKDEVSPLVRPSTRYRPSQLALANLDGPLSLPENRTENEHLALLHWLDTTSQPEVQYIGKQTDKNGVERDAWQYTFTPRWDWPVVDPEVKVYRREMRARKIRRRQRRAAQRRHNRGLR